MSYAPEIVNVPGLDAESLALVQERVAAMTGSMIKVYNLVSQPQYVQQPASPEAGIVG